MKRFSLVLVKPSRYDDNGYVLQYASDELKIDPEILAFHKDHPIFGKF